jgi:hypothetical protein
MFGRVVKLQPLQNRPRPLRREGLIEGGGHMGVQIVDHQAHILGIGVAFLNEVAEAFGEVLAGASLGHRHMPPARERLDHHEQVGRALAHVFIVPPLDGSRLRR